MSVNFVFASKCETLMMNRNDLVFLKCPPVFGLCIFINNLWFEICRGAKKQKL